MRLMTSACAASLTSCPFTLRIWSLAKSFSCEGPSARVHRAPSINKAFVNVCSTWVFSKTSSPITDVYQYFRAYTWSSLTRDIFAQKFPSNNLQDSSTKKLTEVISRTGCTWAQQFKSNHGNFTHLFMELAICVEIFSSNLERVFRARKGFSFQEETCLLQLPRSLFTLSSGWDGRIQGYNCDTKARTNFRT